MKKFSTAIIAAILPLAMSAQTINIKVETSPDTDRIIPKEIYGQFSEHLGSCIYGGLWVGPDSDIPNINGYRLDVFNALKDLKVPVMRWPGGCFADDYHWRDGIGPVEQRVKLVNNNWGGTIEDNSFGTHEFLNLCEMLDIEPYISGNVGSGTVEEMSKWVEYMTANNGPMAELREKNGRKEPWRVKYFGIGNEAWGCGGNMVPEYYSNMYRTYSTYLRDYNGNRLYKIASGASGGDYNWTDVLMKNIGNRMQGVSLHYYTCKGWNGSKGSATQFTPDEYYRTVSDCLQMEELIATHDSIMTVYDPGKHIGLLVDEWGTWFDVEPGTNPGHLFQQNTMRDAMVASLSLDIFHRHTDRVKMANIAQVANVLQSMVLTKGAEMVLTPTYYVFKMYNVHQDAHYLPLTNSSPVKSEKGLNDIPYISATASRDAAGVMHISMTNPDLEAARKVSIDAGQLKGKTVTAEILTSRNIQDYNDFDKTEKVSISKYGSFKVKSDKIEIDVPAKSIITLTIK